MSMFGWASKLGGKAAGSTADVAEMATLVGKGGRRLPNAGRGRGSGYRKGGSPRKGPAQTAGQASAASYKVDPNLESDGIFAVSGQVLKQMGSNLKAQSKDGGWGIAKMVGKHALKGGVAGAAIGGTSEAAQGGSFWTGAKAGAFNGAVGWGAYRTLGRATGATTRNPFGREGAFGKTMDMYGGMSKSAKVLIEGKRAAAVTQANTTRK